LHRARDGLQPESRSRPHSPTPPPRRGPHANGCAWPFISGRHHPEAGSQNPSHRRLVSRRRRATQVRRWATQVRRRLGPPPQTLAGTNRGRREVRDAEPDVRRPSLCAVATWDEPATSVPTPPATLSDSGRPSSAMPSVSPSLRSPRPPLLFPSLNRTPRCSNRRQGEPPALPCASGQSLKKLLVVLHLDP
jgi:hypothetical protein